MQLAYSEVGFNKSYSSLMDECLELFELMHASLSGFATNIDMFIGVST